MGVLDNIKSPEAVTITLNTLTPLYTGGIGQRGDQIHPSNLLGSIKSFSCLLAESIGNTTFSHEVWGAASGEPLGHGKYVGFRWDASGLTSNQMPNKINWSRADGVDRQGWRFNQAQTGCILLSVTRLGISDRHWQLLLLAIRICIKHATFGSKDQWGMGVLEADGLPDVAPIELCEGEDPSRHGLSSAFFAKIQFTQDVGNLESNFERGLRWREYLRASLRPTEALASSPDWRVLRHFAFGKLGQYGSAVNISAMYPGIEGRSEVRVWGAYRSAARRPSLADWEEHVLPTIRSALEAGGPLGTEAVADPAAQWLRHGASTGIHEWVNELAGVYM